MLELLNQNLTFTLDYMVFGYLVLFLFVFIFFIFMLGYIFSKLRSTHEEISEVSPAAYQKALYLLDNAKKESLKIYKDSQNRAKKIIEEAYTFKTDTQEDFENHLQKVTKTELKEFDSFLKGELSSFEDTISKESKDALKVLGDLSKDLKKEVTESINDLKENILKETVESQKMIDTKVGEAYVEVQKELDAYKKEQIEKINDQLSNLLVDVASKSLGVSFSVNQHQDVILNILEEAKKRDLLNF